MLFSCVLFNKLYLGQSPKNERDLLFLKNKKIKSILSLVPKEELVPPKNINTLFDWHNFPLTDHTYDEDISKMQILESTSLLNDLIKLGRTYIHCNAGIERSPFICISWLVMYKNHNVITASDYIKQVHPKANPLMKNILNLKKIINYN